MQKSSVDTAEPAADADPRSAGGPAVFLATLFLIGLLPPSIGIWLDATGPMPFENRNVSPWPSPPETWRDAAKWPKSFSDWFSDRAFGRATALAWHREWMMRYANRSPTDRVILGSDGYLYFAGESPIAFDQNFLGRPALTPHDLAVWRTEFRRRNAWFNSQGITYLMVAVPEKYSIYPEHVPSRFRGSAHVHRIEQLESLMADSPQFLSLRPSLLAAKPQQQLYYRTDSHWNGRGALHGYRAIIDRLHETFPQLKPRSSLVPPDSDDYYVQDLATMIGKPELGVAEREDMRAWYRSFDQLPSPSKLLPNDASANAYPAEWAAERWVSSAPQLPIKVLVFRNSTAVPLRSTLAEHFSETLFLSTHRYSKDVIEREKPALILEIFVERGLGGLSDGYFHLQEPS